MGFLLSQLIPGRGVIYTTLIAFALGMASAGWIAHKLHQADEVGRYESVIAAYGATKIRTSKVETKFADSQANLKTVTKTVYKEITKYVVLPLEPRPVNTDLAACRVPIGAVWMLDAGRQAGFAGVDLPPAAPFADEEGRAASAFACNDLLIDAVDTADRYNEVALQLNALIDWIEASRAPNKD